jgi:hypothetical protein
MHDLVDHVGVRVDGDRVGRGMIAAADADAVDVEHGVARLRGNAHVGVERGLIGPVPVEMAVGRAVEGDLDRLVVKAAAGAEHAEDVVDGGVAGSEGDGERHVRAPQSTRVRLGTGRHEGRQENQAAE